MNEIISVLIPVFNREKFLRPAIRSILKQTYKELDIIVYDDGSTDNSIKLVKELIVKDSRIRLIDGKINKGVGHARNELIKTCNTKYAVWQDSDDLADPTRIEKQIERQLSCKEDCIVFTHWIWLYQMGKQWVKRVKNSDKPGFATILFPVNKDILFNTKKIMGGEDWDFLNRMLTKYDQTTVEEVLYHVRFHNDRIGSWKRKTRFNKDFPQELFDKLSYKEIIEYYKENLQEED